jgi:hypothetical protein
LIKRLCFGIFAKVAIARNQTGRQFAIKTDRFLGHSIFPLKICFEIALVRLSVHSSLLKLCNYHWFLCLSHIALEWASRGELFDLPLSKNAPIGSDRRPRRPTYLASLASMGQGEQMANLALSGLRKRMARAVQAQPEHLRSLGFALSIANLLNSARFSFLRGFFIRS